MPLIQLEDQRVDRTRLFCGDGETVCKRTGCFFVGDGHGDALQRNRGVKSEKIVEVCSFQREQDRIGTTCSEGRVMNLG